nr:hypothetical protein Iba_chr09cCG9440 [Ipomoea batatas]
MLEMIDFTPIEINYAPTSEKEAQAAKRARAANGWSNSGVPIERESNEVRTPHRDIIMNEKMKAMIGGETSHHQTIPGALFLDRDTPHNPYSVNWTSDIGTGDVLEWDFGDTETTWTTPESGEIL